MKKTIAIAITIAALTTGCGGATGLAVLSGINAVDTVTGIAAMGKLAEQNKAMADQRNRQFKTMSQGMADKKANQQAEQKQPDALDDIEKAAEAKQ